MASTIGVMAVASPAGAADRPTLTVTQQLIGTGKSQLAGTTDPGATVDIYAKPSGVPTYSLVATRVAADDGSWHIGTTISRSHNLYVSVAGVTSQTWGTTVYTTSTVKAKALGDGKVRWTVHGNPDAKGVVSVWDSRPRQIGKATTNSKGDVVFVVQSSAGRKRFTIDFKTPGCEIKPVPFTGTVK